MPDLDFKLEDVEPTPHAAVPTLAFKVHLVNATSEPICSIMLRAQIQIEATRRRYSDREQENLLDLFGEPDRWSRTLRSMVWMHITTVVPAFSGETTVHIAVPCSFDFNVAATKYFHGLQEGDLPLLFQFSGSVFYLDHDGTMQFAPISWEKEASFRLPVRVWRELIDSYYPNSAWITLRKDVFDRLYEYKVRSAIPTWEQTVERMLAATEDTVRQ
jgi:hypothetical protein